MTINSKRFPAPTPHCYSTTTITRDAGAIVGQGGPTGMKGH